MRKTSQGQITSSKVRALKIKAGGTVPANEAVYTRPQGKKSYECRTQCRLGRKFQPFFRAPNPEKGETGDQVLDIKTIGFCRTHNRSLHACMALGDIPCP